MKVQIGEEVCFDTKDVAVVTVPRPNGNRLVFTFHAGGVVTELIDRDGDPVGSEDSSYEELSGKLVELGEDFAAGRECSFEDNDDEDDEQLGFSFS